MAYHFYVVGKRNSDCYVIYDNRDGMGGKACASKYTLLQLLDGGYSICGISQNRTKGKCLSVNDITVMTLRGEVAALEKSYSDVPNTKRSFATFVKGIKRTKEEIEKAKRIGEKRSESIQSKKANEDKASTEIIAFYKEAVSADSKNSRLTMSKVMRIYNYRLPDDKRVDDMEQLFDKDGHQIPVYYSKKSNIVVTKEDILSKYEKIIEGLMLRDGKYIQHRLMGDGSSPDAVIKYVLSTTNKPLKYTHGLKYRNPTIRDVPISADRAIACLNEGMCDIKEYEDYIDINTYSGNDMW